jgi:phage tail sheath protein FI
LYIYDRYNDKYRYVNSAGQCAGLRAKTNNDRAQWFASAGLNQGILKGVTKLAQNFSQGQRDLLYKNAVNTIVSFPGQGICLWGNKTATQKPSAFDRVNVRGLFNYAERAISKMSKYVLFEQNSDTTRNMFISTTKPFFDRIKAGQGIDDFLIVCDESNNTPIVRQNNQFIGDFYIKPTYAIEFIQLRFTAVGASISFSQVVG